MHHAHIVLCDRDNFLRAALIEIPDDGDLIRGIDGTVDRERVLHIRVVDVVGLAAGTVDQISTCVGVMI